MDGQKEERSIHFQTKNSYQVVSCVNFLRGGKLSNYMECRAVNCIKETIPIANVGLLMYPTPSPTPSLTPFTLGDLLYMTKFGTWL